MDNPDDLRPTLLQAINARRPAVVEVAVAPYEPPMPARVTSDQVRKLGQSLARGEPNRNRIALTIWRNKVYEPTH